MTSQKISLKDNKLAKAKADLVMDKIFFASLLFSMKIVLDESVGTAATDGFTMWLAPSFIESLDQREIVFLLAHETLHPAYEHLGRLNGRDPDVWNDACDYIINYQLVKEFSGAKRVIGKMPKIGLYDAKLAELGKTADGVYKILMQQKQQMQVPAGGGSGTPQDGQGKAQDGKGNPQQPMYGNAHTGAKSLEKLIHPKDPATAKKLHAEAKLRVAQAAQTAKAMGQLSDNMKLFIDEVTATKKDWREQLRRYMTEKIRDIYSYRRASRRNASDEFLLPSLDGESIGIIDIPCDCSGSVSRKMLSKMAAEINSIRMQSRPIAVRVRYFDSGVCGDTQVFGPDDEVVLEPRGGGGTNFAPIFKQNEEEGISPAVCLVQTDMECNSYGEIVPDYPVLWCCYGKPRSYYTNGIPFGELMIIDEE